MFSDFFILAGILENFERVAIGLCAVAGAFVLGYLLTGFLVWCYYRFYMKTRSSPLVMRAGRLIGGVLAALIVAALYFGEGGFGGGGGTEAPGPEGGPTEGKLVDERKDPTKKESPEKKEGDVRSEDRIQVTLLGDDAVDNRFYLFEHDRRPKTFEELKDLVLQRKRSTEGKPVTELSILLYRNSAYAATPAVKRLHAWAQEHDLRVSYREFKDQDRPE